MQKFGNLLKAIVPVAILLLMLFFGLTKDSPFVKILNQPNIIAESELNPFKTQIDSLKNENEELRKVAVDTVYKTSVVKIPVTVYVDRPISVAIEKDKVKDIVEITGYEAIEDSAKIEKTSPFDKNKYLLLPYDFTLKNDGISFDGSITQDSFTLSNILVESDLRLEEKNDVVDDYRDRKSIMFKYDSPYLQKLNFGYQEQPRITDIGLKKIKRKTAFKSAGWAIVGTGLTAILLKTTGIWK